MSEDLQPNWMNIARRCQSIVCQEQGFAVVTIRVLVGPSGDPVLWMQPKIEKIEPLRGATVFLHTVLERIIE